MTHFEWDFFINRQNLYDIEQGFQLNRDWEEKLDSGHLSISFSDISKPFPQNSYIQIKGYEIKEGEVVNTKYFEYLISSDVVELNNKYELYEHKLTLIEYSAKYDYYMLNTLISSQHIFDSGFAKYKYILDYEHYAITSYPFNGKKNPNSFRVDGSKVEIVQNLYTPPLLLNNEALQGIYNDVNTFTFEVKEVNGSYKSKNKPIVDWFRTTNPKEYETFEAPMYIRLVGGGRNNKYSFDTTNKITLNKDDIGVDDDGSFRVIYGVDMPEQKYFPYNDVTNLRTVPAQEVQVFEYYITLNTLVKNSLYDILMTIRDNVSMYGGIESKLYHSTTRLFNLDDNDAEFLKGIESPQIFLPTATLRQMLSFVLTYVNALPRIINDGNRDILKLEYYNQIQGTFQKEGITDILSYQDTNQIGSRSYSELKNILPNDLSMPTTYTPSQSGYKSVRSENVQLTDTSFELPLVEGKKLYKPVKLVLKTGYAVKGNKRNGDQLYDKYILDIDLTNRWINKNEWDLKLVSDNFPSAYFTKIYDELVGMSEFKTENLYWQRGDTSIKFSDINGQMTKMTLLESVIKSAVNDEVTKNLQFLSKYDDVRSLLEIEYDVNFNDALWFKDLKFRVEYITDENMVIKQDKEDLSQVDFYSEIRHNQDETTINLTRASRKMYGDLQRTGNVSETFSKIHHSFDEMYQVGQVDSDGYVITNVSANYYNYFIEATYTVIKDHNRISQATFIDQTYRWRDNYAEQIIDRNETYNDYLLLKPKWDGIVLEDDITKIVNVENENPTLRNIFGIMGIDRDLFVDNTKASIGLVRTDGFIQDVVDGKDVVNGSMEETYQLFVPISSAGFKQGLVFKFGFENNQIAGVNIELKQDSGTNLYFNRPIRYTYKNGTFRYLDFNILNDYKDINEYKYPYDKVRVLPRFDYMKLSDAITYFSTGKTKLNDTSSDSLIINKDQLSNIYIHYSVNIMSYHNGLFIFGKDFYRNNYLVDNIDKLKNTYLYKYKDGTKYNIFEDLKVKNGWYDRISNEGYNFITLVGNEIIIYGLQSDDTSWAIGDKDGNLIFASNENIDEIEIVQMHHRPNVDVIGNNGIKEKIKVSTNISFITSIENEVTFGLDLFGNIGVKVVNNVTDGLSLNIENININISSLLDNDIYESIELFGLVGVGVNNEINVNEVVTVDNVNIILKGIIETEIIESIELYGLVGVNVSQVNELEQALNITNNVFVTGLIETEIIEELVLYGGVKVGVNNEIDVDKPLRPNLSVSIKGVMVNEVLNRVRLTFISDGSVYTTMNVNVGELLYYPSTPTRPNYTFNGWYSNTSGGTRLYNPFVAPSIDTTYYAQWTYTPQNPMWQYYGTSSSPVCFPAGYNPIGTACTTQGEKMTVSGEDIGRPDGCYELICKI